MPRPTFPAPVHETSMLATTFPSVPASRMAIPSVRTDRLCTVLPLPPAPMVSTGLAVPIPSTSTIGLSTYSGWVVPSMTTGSVMVGRADWSWIVWGPPPPMLKEMVFSPASELASSMAARRVTWAPGAFRSTSTTPSPSGV